MKTAIITGAASGIGKGTAELFAEEGAALVLVDRNGEKLEAVAAALRDAGAAVAAVAGDVALEDTAIAAVAAARQQFGRLDILFNNAGIMPLGSVVDYPVLQWDEVMNVNVRSMFLMIKHSIPLMQESGGGSIVNTSSVNAFLTEPDHVAYTSSKAAIIGLSKQVGVEFAAQGIRCNAICPGWVATEMNLKLADELGGIEKVNELVKKQQPLGRMSSVREIAYAALFLASDEASSVTATCLYVDGGCSASI